MTNVNFFANTETDNGQAKKLYVTDLSIRVHKINYKSECNFTKKLNVHSWKKTKMVSLPATLYRWVRAILLYVPIHCIGTYNNIALTNRYRCTLFFGKHYRERN